MVHYCDKCFRKIEGGVGHQEWCPYFQRIEDVFADMFNTKK